MMRVLRDKAPPAASVQAPRVRVDTATYPRAWVTAGTALGLFIVALIVRWWGLGAQTHQMWGDEAQFMTFARRFIQGIYTTPFMADPRGLPALYDLVLSVPLRLLGQLDVTVAREFSGLLGALSVPLLYLTALELSYPQRVGIVAATALATTFWDVSFSRLVLPNIMGVAATSAVVLLLVMAVRRTSLPLAVLAGIALAWSCNAHLTGMMAVPIVAGWLALLLGGYSQWWKHGRSSTGGRGTAAAGGRRDDTVMASRRWFQYGRKSGPLLDLNRQGVRLEVSRLLAVTVVFTVAALVAAWPLLQLYFSPGSPIQGHAVSRYILSAENRAAFAAGHPDVGGGIAGILWYQLLYTAGLFTVRGQPGGVFNLENQPLLDAISGPLFILGVAAALWMWRRPAATLILLWLIVPLVLGVTLTIDPVWSFHRAVTAAPAMCLLIALGLEAVFVAAWTLLRRMTKSEVLSRRLIVTWPHVRLVATALVAIGAGAQGIGHYWDFVDAPATRQAFDNGTHEWALFLRPRGAVAVTVVGPAGWPTEYPALFAPAAHICAGRWGDTWAHCPPARIVIFDADPTDAQQYARATRIPVHLDLSPDKVTSFWYADAPRLPDPAQVLANMS